MHIVVNTCGNEYAEKPDGSSEQLCLVSTYLLDVKANENPDLKQLTTDQTTRLLGVLDQPLKG